MTTIKLLRRIIRESIQDASPAERWPWITHFPDARNEEGMAHPGNWKEPSIDDFHAALKRMSQDEVDNLAHKASRHLELPQGPLRDWRRSKKLKQTMFEIWNDKEMWAHRDKQNTYFAPSRRRDAEHQKKLMQDPENRKMMKLRHDRDRAEVLGVPWFPDKDDLK